MPSELEVLLEHVRVDFVQRLHSQLPQVRSIRQRIGVSAEESDFEMIGAMAHKICGIAKTVGYLDLGNAARELEVAISDSREKKLPRDVGEISNLLDSLIIEMGSASSNPDSGLIRKC